MRTIINTPSQPAHSILIEKKSEFIADACHISTFDEGLAFIQRIKAQHPKARHVCFAAVLGANESTLQERMSDDGEPSGTAGKPILQVLRQSGTTNTAITVTRYFGGILLGAGGLVRAYSSAASAVLVEAEDRNILEAREVMCNVEYPQFDTLTRIITQCHGRILTQNFTDKVFIRALIPTDLVSEYENTIEHTFYGTVHLEYGEIGSLIE